jgi:outer membrane protein assembly factor BamB
MSEYRSLLEQAGERFPEPTLPIDAVMRTRDRRERQRRVATLVVALVVAAAVIGSLSMLRRSLTVPADRITIDTVGTLEQAWMGDAFGAAPVPVPGGVAVFTPTTQMGGVDEMDVFPVPCGEDGLCAPAWSVSEGAAGHRAADYPVVVANGTVFAGTVSGDLLAFPTSCQQASCDRSWYGRTSGVMAHQGTGSTQLFHTISVVEVSGSRVYATDVDSGGTFAFPVTCEKRRCDALWGSRDVSAPTAIDGSRVAVRTRTGVAVYPTACWERQGPSCDALWTRALAGPPTGQRLRPPLVVGDLLVVAKPGSVMALEASNGATRWAADVTGGATRLLSESSNVLATSGSTVQAFPTSCAEACQPAWSVTLPGAIDPTPVVADGWVYVTSRATQTLYALGPGCRRSCGPAWTASMLGDPQGSPVVSDGVLYVAGSDGLQAFASTCATDGRACPPALTWSPSSGEGLRSGPVVMDGTLVVAGEESLFGLTPAGR